MSGNAKLAGTVISTAMALGAKDFVICGGARNVPLITDLESRKDIQLWNHFDERSAGFFALGLVKPSGKPVAVVTTSGTAVAELLPAVVEAWYSGVPLIAITADRPVSFRGTGAPQAIEQVGIFGDYVSDCLDLEYSNEISGEIDWNQSSPLHLNVCFEEPGPEPPETGDPLPISIGAREADVPDCKIPRFENPVVLVGALKTHQRKPVAQFLLDTAIPAWLEATSGLREDQRLLEQRIDDSEIRQLEPAEIIRIGEVPSLRFWRDLEELDSVRVINLTDLRFPGLGRSQHVTTLPFSKIDDLTGYRPGPGRVPSETKQGTVAKLLSRHDESEPAAIRKLSKIIPKEAGVFLGNSLPLREWNLAATREIPHPDCFANRGANGIDGEISSFLGISRGYTEAWGIFGDLTALYDLNSLWIANQLPPGKRRIVVINNGGGRIFSRLPAMRSLGTRTMALTGNHHETDFRGWADLWGWQYHSWSAGDQEWSVPETDRAIAEIKIDQEKSEAFWSEFSS